MTADGVGAPGSATDGDSDGDGDGVHVPLPRPPGDGEAWYAPEILDQRTVHPGVVTTVRERAGQLRYLVCEGRLGVGELFAFLADLRTDEAATVERVRRRSRSDAETGNTAPDGGPADEGAWSGTWEGY